MINQKTIEETSFDKSFNTVMANVHVDDRIKSKIYQVAIRDFIDGCARPDAIYTELLPEHGFDWDTFNYFYDFFKNKNIAPQMWHFSYTNMISGITPIFICRNILKEKVFKIIKAIFGNNVTFKTKKDCMLFIEANIISDEDKYIFLQEAKKYDLDELIEDYEYDFIKTKSILVGHNITMLAYALRYLSDDYYKHLDISPDNFKVTPVNTDFAEKYFSELWNTREIHGHPPFFPGDRNLIRIRRDMIEHIFK